MQKRGQGMQMEVVVAVFLALVLLGGLVWLYLTYSGKFRTGVQACEAQAGQCITGTSPQDCYARNAKPHPYTCPNNYVCCIGG